MAFVPFVPSPHATIPLEVFQPVFLTTKFPLLVNLIISAAEFPREVEAIFDLIVLIKLPVSPLNKYIAPASDAPESSPGLETNIFPVDNAEIALPKLLFAAGFGSVNGIL